MQGRQRGPVRSRHLRPPHGFFNGLRRHGPKVVPNSAARRPRLGRFGPSSRTPLEGEHRSPPLCLSNGRGREAFATHYPPQIILALYFPACACRRRKAQDVVLDLGQQRTNLWLALGITTSPVRENESLWIAGTNANLPLQALANRDRRAYSVAVNGTGTSRGREGRQEE